MNYRLSAHLSLTDPSLLCQRDRGERRGEANHALKHISSGGDRDWRVRNGYEAVCSFGVVLGGGVRARAKNLNLKKQIIYFYFFAKVALCTATEFRVMGVSSVLSCSLV